MAVNKVVFGAVSIMDISDSTVTADKLAKGVTAYDKAGEKITGTMEASSAPILQEKTVTPSTAAQNITADNGYDGLSKVTVNGDANLTADNIKLGTSIFGVTGSYAGSSPNLQSKSVTYTSNGTATITPDSGYDGLSSVDVTVNVSGGYKLKKVTYKPSVNKLIGDITITHNCGSIPKFVIVMSNNYSSSTYYLMGGFGVNESQTPSFFMVVNIDQVKASVTSRTFTYIDTSLRYYNKNTYTYYFFY